MKDSRYASRPSIPDDGASIVLCVTGVNDEGKPYFRGEGDLGRESVTLNLARRVVVVIVEATLANRDGPVPKELAKLG